MHHFFQTWTANVICRKICVDRPKISVTICICTLLLHWWLREICYWFSKCIKTVVLFCLWELLIHDWEVHLLLCLGGFPRHMKSKLFTILCSLIIADSTVMTSTAVCTVQFISITHMITHLRHKVHLLVSNNMVSTSMVILKKVSIIINAVNPP